MTVEVHSCPDPSAPADPACEALILLWSGRPVQAEAALNDLLSMGDSPRLRALRADTWRDQGRYDQAIRAYRALVKERAGTPGEAVMLQHLGKAYFAANRFREAQQAFGRALELRISAGSEEDLIASSRLAWDRATQRLEASNDSEIPTL